MSLTTVSASGKVLIAGGYLVLDQTYSGVVVSTSSRFYTVIRTGSSASNNIRVSSPQFKSAVWEYGVELEDDGVEVSQADDTGAKNKFVFIALQQTLKLVREMKGAEQLKNALSNGLDVVIIGGNDFYSQRAKLAELGLPPLLSSLARIPPFAHTGVPLAGVHKTGLGSSAALITSLVAALLVHLGAVPPSALDAATGPGRALAHNAAQFVHCLAQGKVGSGFDVASAVFGSQLYTRFAPAAIGALMGEGAAGPLLPTLSPENKAWDHKVEPFQLPPCTRLMLADVDAGSDTPSLVGRVLKWRQSAGAEAKAFWDALAASNGVLARTLMRLSELHAEDPGSYTETIERLAPLQAQEWSIASAIPVAHALLDVHKWSEDIRAKMREMGNRSGVPIEPPEQTELLDACIAQAGVVGGGVPGAGGYDAVWVLVLDPPSTDEKTKPLHRVEKVWAAWTKLDVSPLSATESFEKGLRLERVEDVPGLAEVLAAL